MSEQSETIFVKDEAFKDRLHTCFNCENLSMVSVCSKSGLDMNIAAKLRSSSCPDAKWLAQGT